MDRKSLGEFVATLAGPVVFEVARTSEVRVVPWSMINSLPLSWVALQEGVLTLQSFLQEPPVIA